MDIARHSALREAAVKPAASDRVFSLDDVRKEVRSKHTYFTRAGITRILQGIDFFSSRGVCVVDSSAQNSTVRFL